MACVWDMFMGFQFLVFGKPLREKSGFPSQNKKVSRSGLTSISDKKCAWDYNGKDANEGLVYVANLDRGQI